MLNDKVEAIVFDFGNVIININVELTLKAFAKLSHKPLEKVQSIFEEDDIFRRYEIGTFEDDEFREVLRQAMGYPFSNKEIDQAWNALLLDIPLERIELIDNLRTRYPIYLLSNTNSIHIKECDKRFKNQFGINQVKDLFSHAFYSFEMGLWKPQAEIYTQMLKEIGKKPENVLFIDDNLSNIEGASLLGIQTIHLIPPDNILNHIKI